MVGKIIDCLQKLNGFTPRQGRAFFRRVLKKSELNDFSWNWSNAGNRTQPVGTKVSSALGIYDLIGNVAEWLSDGIYTDKGVEYAIVIGGAFTYSECIEGKLNAVGHARTYRWEAIGLRLVFSPQ